MDHLTSQALEAFVLGVAEPGDVDRLRRHVSGCQLCARKLQREARLESLLQEVALGDSNRSGPPTPLARLGPALWIGTVAGLLIAGSAWVLLRTSGMPETRPAAIPSLWIGAGAPVLMDSTAIRFALDTFSPSDYCRLIGGQVSSRSDSLPGQQASIGIGF